MSRATRRPSHKLARRGNFAAGDTKAVRDRIAQVIGFASGVDTWDNLNPGEYNPALRGRLALETYNRMLLNDTQVYAVATAIDTPIRGARWRFEAGGSSALDKQVCDFVEDNLRNRMRTTLSEAFRIMVSSVMQGVAVQEREYVVDGGMVRLAQLHDRPPSVVERFVYAGSQLSHLTQAGLDEDQKYQRVDIPADRLFITSFEPRGASVIGAGLCRHMYTPWYCKHGTIKLLQVGLEISLIGTPYFQVPKGMGDTSRAQLLAAIEDLRVRDVMGFVVDNDVVPGILEGSRSPIDALPIIEFYNVEISRAGLAHFINLGTQQSGSGDRSVSDSQVRTFLEKENAIADGIEENINRNLIPELCRFNWPGLTVFPKIRHADITQTLRLQTVGDALSKLANVGLLTPRAEVENVILDWYDMPPLEVSKTAEPPAKKSGAPNDPPAKSTERISVTPSCDCGAAAHFSAPSAKQVGDLFDQVGDAFQAQASKLLQAMVDRMAAAVKEPLAKLGDGLSRAKVFPILAQLELPGKVQYREALGAYFDDLVAAAFAAAVAVQGGETPPISPDLAAYLRAERDLLTERHLSDIRFAFIQQVLDGAASATPLAQLLSDASQAARDKANADFRDAFLTGTQQILAEVPDYLLAHTAPSAAPLP